MKEELLEMAKRAKPTIAVIGIGGVGCNISTWIAEKGMAGGRIIAAILIISTLSKIFILRSYIGYFTLLS